MQKTFVAAFLVLCSFDNIHASSNGKPLFSQNLFSTPGDPDYLNKEFLRMYGRLPQSQSMPSEEEQKLSQNPIQGSQKKEPGIPTTNEISGFGSPKNKKEFH